DGRRGGCAQPTTSKTTLTVAIPIAARNGVLPRPTNAATPSRTTSASPSQDDDVGPPAGASAAMTEAVASTPVATTGTATGPNRWGTPLSPVAASSSRAGSALSR